MFANVTMQSGALLIGLMALFGLIAAGLIVRGGVHAAILAVESRRDTRAAKERAAFEDAASRLAHNPWSRVAGAWNMTRQIELMREDFDGAKRLASEAGFEIEHLRDKVNNAVPVLAIVGTNDPFCHDVPEDLRHPIKDNVDPSYFGLDVSRKVRKARKSKARKAHKAQRRARNTL